MNDLSFKHHVAVKVMLLTRRFGPFLFWRLQKASTLLERIGSERSWSSRDVEKDVDILERNRLYTIKDLRVLSGESWKVKIAALFSPLAI